METIIKKFNIEKLNYQGILHHYEWIIKIEFINKTYNGNLPNGDIEHHGVE